MAHETILVVDDEKEIRNLITIYLKNEGYKVLQAGDGEEGLRLLEENEVHLVVLDIMMPKVDGIHMCMKVREAKEMPIIMLSAKTQDMDKILGLTTGADDYVTKPFSTRELLARVKANLRRHQQGGAAEKEENTEMVIGPIVINPNAYSVTKREENIELTHREFELLHYLAKHLGQVMTREHLLQTVWGYDYFGDVRTVDVTVRRLREKIEDNPSHPTLIVTRRGVGYYLRDPEQE